MHFTIERKRLPAQNIETATLRGVALATASEVSGLIRSLMKLAQSGSLAESPMSAACPKPLPWAAACQIVSHCTRRGLKPFGILAHPFKVFFRQPGNGGFFNLHFHGVSGLAVGVVKQDFWLVFLQPFEDLPQAGFAASPFVEIFPDQLRKFGRLGASARIAGLPFFERAQVRCSAVVLSGVGFHIIWKVGIGLAIGATNSGCLCVET